MKILVIHGSMRKGNTYAVTKKLIYRLLTKGNVECVELGIAELNLPLCTSCHLCLTNGEEYCPHYEIMSAVQTALTECDGIIFSGTTYARALNAAMKNLIDHLSYGYHRPALFGKKGMVVATSAGLGDKGVAKYLRTVLGQWGVNDAIMVTRNIKQQRLQSLVKEQNMLNNAADRFYELLESDFPIAPSFNSIATHNAFRAMSMSEFSESKRDTEYWQQDGFYNKAYPTKAGPFKYMAGSMVHGLAKLTAKLIGRTCVR